MSYSKHIKICVADVAEWLRRLTRNQLGFARVGSNPTVRDLLICLLLYYQFPLHLKSRYFRCTPSFQCGAIGT